MKEPQQTWTETIESSHSLFDLKLGEVWRYRDLVYMFVKRDFVSEFKQTVLGPIWFFLHPLFTTLIYVFIFGRVAKIPTDGIPPVLFYLSGVTLWNFFMTNVTSISGTFLSNAGIFGKVYFPRMVSPISMVISNSMKSAVQFLMFLCFFFYYLYQGKIHPNIWMLLTPAVIFLMAVFSMGIGLIFSSMTTKYRDLAKLMGFGLSLYMYITPVIYPSSVLPARFRFLSVYNPLSPLFEAFKFGWFGTGSFTGMHIIFSAVLIFAVFLIGLVLFNRTEKTFMDNI